MCTNNLVEVENARQENLGIIHCHPLDYLDGVVYVWQQKFSRWHNLVTQWTSTRTPQLMTDKAVDIWTKAKAAANFLRPKEGDLIRKGLYSKGVTVVPDVDEAVSRRSVDLSLGENNGCECHRWLELAAACKHAHAIADWSGASLDHEAWVRYPSLPCVYVCVCVCG